VSVRVDDQGRGHVEMRRVRGPVAAVGLLVFIAVFTVVAGFIHRSNIEARQQTRRAAEAAEAAGTPRP